MTLRLPDEPVDVAPGAEATARARVCNVGTVVDELTVEVAGAPGAWIEVVPERVAVYPGDEASVTLAFRPPRDPTVPAGRTSYQVVTRSVLHDGIAAEQVGAVDVGRFDDVSVSLVPREATSRRGTTHRLTVENQGNAEARVEVSGSDRQDELDLRIDPAVLTLAPGTHSQVQVRARSRRRLWRGDDRSRPFTLVVRTETGQELPTDGVSVQRSLLPARALTMAVAALVLLAVAVTALVWRPLVPVPDVVGLSFVDAAAQLEGRGLVPGEVRLEDSDEAPETVLTTDPPAGQWVWKPETVTMTVATGPRFAVPNVVNLPFEQAVQEVRAAGLAVERESEVSDEPEGTVVAVDPEPGREVSGGSTVILTVAEPRTVPAVVGREEGVAVEAIEERGLQAEVVPEPSDEQAGMVLGMDPPAGQVVPEGTVIRVTVAAPRLTVPDVVGQSAEAAVRAIERLGLEVSRSTEPSGQSPGTVLRSDPVAGEVVEPGDVVHVVVASPLPVEVPDLLGQTLGQAREALTALGLRSEEQGDITDAERALCAKPPVVSLPDRAPVDPELTLPDRPLLPRDPTIVLPPRVGPCVVQEQSPSSGAALEPGAAVQLSVT